MNFLINHLKVKKNIRTHQNFTSYHENFTKRVMIRDIDSNDTRYLIMIAFQSTVTVDQSPGTPYSHALNLIEKYVFL